MVSKFGDEHKRNSEDLARKLDDNQRKSNDDQRQIDDDQRQSNDTDRQNADDQRQVDDRARQSDHRKSAVTASKDVNDLCVRVEFLQNDLEKLEDIVGDIASKLLTMQISVSRLDEMLSRQRSMETDVKKLNDSFIAYDTKFEALKNTMAEIKNLLIGLLVALVPVFGTVVWEVIKQALQIK